MTDTPSVMAQRSTETQFDHAAGRLTLRRHPHSRQSELRAWNAADRLLIDAAMAANSQPYNTLVANDAFGAITLALSQANDDDRQKSDEGDNAGLLFWSDSALSLVALQRNAALNGLTPPQTVPITQSPPKVGAVVMPVPKQRAFYEYQLKTLARCLDEGARLFAGGMDKHLFPDTAELLERYIGPTERYRGERKARIFVATRRALSEDTSPKEHAIDARQNHYDIIDSALWTLPNVFSSDGLDQGSRLLMQNCHRLAPVERVIDLACGNGVLGLYALQQGLAQHVFFTDESAMAVECARRNHRHLFQDAEHAVFAWADGLSGYAADPVDLVLCNPPFHSGHTVDITAGRHVLSRCADHLSARGKLCLVANRHLNYRGLLKRRFAHVEQLAANRKFVVLLAHKSTN